MKFLKEQDKGKVKELEAAIKNKWSWKWIHQTIVLKGDSANNSIEYSLGDCVVKIDTPGVAYCLFCNDKLNCGGNGKNDIVAHCSTGKHVTAAKARLYQPTLSGTGPRTQDEVINISKSSTASETKQKIFSILKANGATESENIVASGSPVVPPNPSVPLKPKLLYPMTTV